MFRTWRRVCLELVGVGFMAMLASLPATAQFDDFALLGLSAAPDRYEPTIVIDSDEHFVLYFLAKGPDEASALPFDLLSLSWAVLAPCCGASYEVIAIDYNSDLVHEGYPLSGVQSTAEVCLDQDYLVLAALTFEMRVPAPGIYRIPAGAIGPALDCNSDPHFFADLAVDAIVDMSSTPNESLSWGTLKTHYRQR